MFTCKYEGTVFCAHRGCHEILPCDNTGPEDEADCDTCPCYNWCPCKERTDERDELHEIWLEQAPESGIDIDGDF